MDSYGRVVYRDDYPPPRRDPRSYDRFPQGAYAPPPQVEYARPADRVYAAMPATMSYPAPPSNRTVEIRYYDPDIGPPFQTVPFQPAPAPAPPPQQQQIQLPTGCGSQFVPGQLYKVVGVEETQLYHSAPPQPRTAYVPSDYGGYPSVPRGPPSRGRYQQY